MTKLPKISIIIPVYNVEEYITACLQSVMCQTYTGKIECILVDDCGKDNSIALAEQLVVDYKGPIEFRILRHDHNRGLSAARNTGTKDATGEYIYFLDSDDSLTPNCINLLTHPLSRKKYDMVVGNYSVVGADWGIPKLWLEEGEYEDVLNLYATHGFYMMAWNKLIRKEVLDNYHISFMEGMIHEDDLWSFHLAQVLSKIYVCQEITYLYLVRNNSLMDINNLKIRDRDAYRDVMLDIARYLNKERDNYVVIDFMLDYYLKMIIRISNTNKVPFKSIYYELRKSFSYSALHAYINGIIKKRKFIVRIHFNMTPLMGYLWLKLMYSINLIR